MVNDDIWVGLINPKLDKCTPNDCRGEFWWTTGGSSAAEHLEGDVEANGDGSCFVMANDTGRWAETRFWDRGCRIVAKFACEFSCKDGECEGSKSGHSMNDHVESLSI